ncbi:MAG: carbonate dehydratase [Acidobacteriota bacterium]|nr:carbonate dehydratase [Acidobacteriota bacterium]
MKRLQHLLDNNKRWSAKINAERPMFFPNLAAQQTPEYVWIGCSDSRVSANTIVGLTSGEIFVHRNVANQVIHTDLNCLSVLQFAVEYLHVKHIIVCGHYGCGGVAAALDGKRHGLIDNWLRHIQDTANLYAETLGKIANEREKADKLCELNVIEQVINVGATTVVQDAWTRMQNLTVHGWIYSIEDGIISDLDVCLTGETDLKALRKRIL